jgi:hypothetical protein
MGQPEPFKRNEEKGQIGDADNFLRSLLTNEVSCPCPTSQATLNSLDRQFFCGRTE